MKVYLASKSPRRRELLTAMGVEYTVVDAKTDETVPKGTHPKDAVKLLALKKCRAGAKEAGDPLGLYIGSDTLVELDGEALGKPKTKEEALEMLLRLSGKTHRVYTGVAVCRGDKVLVDAEETSVVFRPFDGEEAWRYVLTGEPMDKAGAYGIQGLGGALVDHTEGEFDNVIGFPTRLVRRLMEEVAE